MRGQRGQRERGRDLALRSRTERRGGGDFMLIVGWYRGRGYKTKQDGGWVKFERGE